MRNVHEVLKQKEADCVRLRHEIEALRIVVPLLDEQALPNRAALGEERTTEDAKSELGAEGERNDHELESGAPAEIDVERKGPLSSSLRESSWWKRQGNR